MAKAPLAPITFGVVYFTEFHAVIGVGTIEARDYWAACKLAWKELRRRRRKAADFQLVEDDAALEGGPSRIRAAAVALVQLQRETRGDFAGA